MRVCRGCGAGKPETEFYKASRGGLDGKCKECRRAMVKAYRDENPEKARESVASSRAKKPHLKAEADRAWRKRNPERKRENARAWYDSERAREYYLRWKAKDPERAKAAQSASSLRNRPIRRARLKGNGEHEVFDRQEIWDRDGGCCHLCGEAVRGNWHLDHIIPISLGGPHTRSNVAVSHPSCNQSKGNRVTGEQIRAVE